MSSMRLPAAEIAKTGVVQNLDVLIQRPISNLSRALRGQASCPDDLSASAHLVELIVSGNTGTVLDDCKNLCDSFSRSWTNQQRPTTATDSGDWLVRPSCKQHSTITQPVHTDCRKQCRMFLHQQSV